MVSSSSSSSSSVLGDPGAFSDCDWARHCRLCLLIRLAGALAVPGHASAHGAALRRRGVALESSSEGGAAMWAQARDMAIAPLCNHS
jgi:hypothetical protein